MEVTLCVPIGTDISVVEKKYPDIWEDEGWEDHQRYFVGRSMDEEEDAEESGLSDWMSYDECVEFCGFAEGALGDEVNTLIEGNGGWAQRMMSRRDFSSMAIDKKQKHEYKRISNLYWKAHKHGAASKSNRSLSLPDERNS